MQQHLEYPVTYEYYDSVPSYGLSQPIYQYSPQILQYCDFSNYSTDDQSGSPQLPIAYYTNVKSHDTAEQLREMTIKINGTCEVIELNSGFRVELNFLSTYDAEVAFRSFHHKIINNEKILLFSRGETPSPTTPPTLPVFHTLSLSKHSSPGRDSLRQSYDDDFQLYRSYTDSSTPSIYFPTYTTISTIPNEFYQFDSTYPPNMSYYVPAYQTRPPITSSPSRKQQEPLVGSMTASGRIRTTHPEPDKGNYKLDLERIKSKQDIRTTLMIKNIPNKYAQNMVLDEINVNHKKKYDFFYLPIDFKNKCNVGYAFINFIDPMDILSFFTEFNNRKWNKYNSEKICEVRYGRIQGKQTLINHFKNSSVMNVDQQFRPLLFHSSGNNRGESEQFPTQKSE